VGATGKKSTWEKQRGDRKLAKYRPEETKGGMLSENAGWGKICTRKWDGRTIRPQQAARGYENE